MKKTLAQLTLGAIAATTSGIAAFANPALLPSSFQLRGGLSGSNKIGNDFDSDSDLVTQKAGNNDFYLGADLYGGPETGWNWRLSTNNFGGAESFYTDIDGGYFFDTPTKTSQFGLDVGYGLELSSVKARLYAGAAYLNSTQDFAIDGDGDSGAITFDTQGLGFLAGASAEVDINDAWRAFGSVDFVGYSNADITYSKLGGDSDSGSLDLNAITWNFGLGYALADNIDLIGGIAGTEIDYADNDSGVPFARHNAAYVGIDIDF